MSALLKLEWIAQTQTHILSWDDLTHFRSLHQLTYAEWRQIGDHQKRLFAALLSSDPQAIRRAALVHEFEKNIFLLEAVVEHFVSPKNQPPVNFLNPSGSQAKAEGKRILFVGDYALERVRPGYDTISIFSPNSQTTSVYSIKNVHPQTNIVEVESDTSLPDSIGAWRINLRPVLLLIDSFGERIHGDTAKVINEATLSLGVPLNTLKLNPHFDTIFLEQDTSRTTKTYRIIAIDEVENTIELDAAPSLKTGISNWGIPAGVGGQLPNLTYDLGSTNPERPGWDHYDGTLFIINHDSVEAAFRWTSYTSHYFPQNHRLLSSIQGNQAYRYTSQRANTVRNINYAFSVFNFLPPDEPLPAYYYFDETLSEDIGARGELDTPGKTEVMIHIGWTQTGQAAAGDGTGSAGCLVSPFFYDLRKHLIENYQREHRLQTGTVDTELQKLVGLTHQESVGLWLRTQNGEGDPANQLSAAQWNDKLMGTLWLIRPDERTLNSS